MDYSKIFGLAMALIVEVKKDSEDKKITVGELLDILGVVIAKLGLQDKVILDLNEHK